MVFFNVSLEAPRVKPLFGYHEKVTGFEFANDVIIFEGAFYSLGIYFNLKFKVFVIVFSLIVQIGEKHFQL